MTKLLTQIEERVEKEKVRKRVEIAVSRIFSGNKNEVVRHEYLLIILE